MKNKALPTLLLIATIGVVSTHLEWIKTDNGHLLYVDGRAIDVFGHLNNLLTKISRDCRNVENINKNDQVFSQISSVIKEYSPPDSGSAKIASLIQTEGWSLAEVEFNSLLPAVVLLNAQDKVPTIIANGIWSGYTKPFESAPYIRKYIREQVVAAPPNLINCFEPISNSFK
jgi:hypothetical protein